MPARIPAITRWLPTLGTLLLLSALGCGGDANEATPSDAAVPLAALPDQLELVDAAGLRQTLDDARGKVLLLNVWASWCSPCVGEFRVLRGLHEDFRSEPMEIIGLSLDDLSVSEQPIRTFLARTEPSFRVIVRGTIEDGALRALLDPSWDGSLPTTFVFDRTGKLSQYLVGVQDQASFERVVRPLL